MGIGKALSLTCGMIALASLAGVLVLMRHEDQVRFWLRVDRGYIQGRDWVWAHPRDLGQSLFFSVPQPRDLHTGEILWTPLLG